MRILAWIAISLMFAFAVTRSAIAGDQAQPSASAATQTTAPGDELHFVSMLTARGEIVSLDRGDHLITLKDENGSSSKTEVRSENDLESLAPGDRVVVRYFEGAVIGMKHPHGTVPIESFKSGIIAAESGGRTSIGKHRLVAEVERIDRAEQEITLKGPDGSIETIMVANPDELSRLKVGDQVVVGHARALALSIKKSS